MRTNKCRLKLENAFNYNFPDWSNGSRLFVYKMKSDAKIQVIKKEKRETPKIVLYVNIRAYIWVKGPKRRGFKARDQGSKILT